MDVIFRKFKSEQDIIAFFPQQVNPYNGLMMSYQHIGQHGEADYKGLLSITVLASKDEYLPLLIELQKIYGECKLNIKQKSIKN